MSPMLRPGPQRARRAPGRGRARVAGGASGRISAKRLLPAARSAGMAGQTATFVAWSRSRRRCGGGSITGGGGGGRGVSQGHKVVVRPTISTAEPGANSRALDLPNHFAAVTLTRVQRPQRRLQRVVTCRQRMRSAFGISPQGDIPGRFQVTRDSHFFSNVGTKNSGAKRARTADLLHAIWRQHVHPRPSLQVTVLSRPRESASVRTSCGTFLLYSAALPSLPARALPICRRALRSSPPGYCPTAVLP